MKFLCDVLGVTRWDQIRNEHILCSVNEVPINDQLKHLRLQWLVHVMRMDSVSSTSSCVRLKGKVRPRGGTPLKWINLVMKDHDGIED